MATPRKKPEDKLKVGRKEGYKPEFCEQVIKLMSQGKSLTAAAGAMGFWPQVFYDWAKRHPEFADALNAGRAKRVDFLETGLLKYGGNKDTGRITARIFALKCTNDAEWREKGTDLALNMQVGGEVKITIVDPKK